ncbi:UNVERIFIED_CONTAM: hypothetical protein Slati_1449600 [Sesamum latifolium]|uniref:Uncharacterized protein n=1 Tax=Sesamum latifolium TaxID=2727402 RepID=A0AAW2X433_9LAMI
MNVANFQVRKVLVDIGSSVDIFPLEVVKKMDLDVVTLKLVSIPLRGFGGSEVILYGTINLPTSMVEDPYRKTEMLKYLVVDEPFAYNMILGRTA